MEYPGSHFTRPYRIALLALFVAAFFIITPLILLATAGYRYDWHNGLLKEVGALSIDVVPNSTAVTVNNQSISKKIPVRINAISPGRYTIGLSSPGYYPWRQEVEIKNKHTVYIKDIELIKKDTPRQITAGLITDLSVSPDGQFLFYIQTSQSEQTLFLRNTQTKTTRVILSGPPNTPAFHAWSPESTLALVPGGLPAKQLLLVNPAKSNAETTIDSSEPITAVHWSNSPSNELFYSTASSLVLVLPNTGQQTVIGTNTFADWYPHDGKIWALETSTTTPTLQVIKDVFGFRTTLGRIPISPPAAVYNSGWQIQAVYNDTVVAADTYTHEARLISASTQSPELAWHDFDHSLLSRFDNWFIWWNELEIWKHRSPQEPTLLYRSGEAIQEVTPLDKNNTLALVTSKRTLVLFPAYQVTLELPIAAQHIAVDPNKRILYFVGLHENKSGLWELAY